MSDGLQVALKWEQVLLIYFFLWGYIKAEVYKHRRKTLKALKDAICEEVATIPPEVTNIVMENFRERLRQCIANNGRHLSDVIFKT